MITILETIKLDNNEIVHIDLNDLLDILEETEKSRYSLVFKDGEIWHNIKLKKSVLNRFAKIKEKRNQT